MDLVTAIYILSVCFLLIGLLVWRLIELQSRRQIETLIKGLECMKPSRENHYPSLHEYNRLIYLLDNDLTEFRKNDARVKRWEQDSKR